MKIETFIQIFKDSFDELNTNISSDTLYKKISEWISIQALFFIAHLDDTTGVVLSAEDLVTTNTIEDLYKIVLKRI